ncbi:uncharacterized protein EV420DRAFT_302061 [Desarmillaria tabescens]|uniref:Uncharacterized protein n=1 Tax=Armillaria tabescens TaxID=1929756 RepID=A0AA39KDB7_ARMTA|nr:uncharacterized protein EV420DRAFT_302061 [Desarmillaria tabescens]KAK0459081.1 hypothetical protein EV420DRAFT_302061 [Desarmillaria tabescens]
MSEKFSKYVVYKPSGGDAMVKSGRSTIYSYPGDEAFYASIDTYLVDTTWVSKMSWENNTTAAQTYSLQYTTELKVTQGSEVTNSVGIGAEFKGLSMSMDSQTKTFTTYETTETLTKTITLSVPPKSTLTFYQKKYRFRSTMFFVLDAWNEEWNAGSPGGYDITRKECQVEIMSEDYLTTDVALVDSATGTMDVKRVSRADLESRRKTRKRENLTERAKKELSKMGV